MTNEEEYTFEEAQAKFVGTNMDIVSIIGDNFELFWLNQTTGEILNRAEEPITDFEEFYLLEDDNKELDFSNDLDCGAFCSDPDPK